MSVAPRGMGNRGARFAVWRGYGEVFRLLREALQHTDKVAAATFVMRCLQHSCAVTAQGDSLMLPTLRFAGDASLPARGEWSPASLTLLESLGAGVRVAGMLTPARGRAGLALSVWVAES